MDEPQIRLIQEKLAAMGATKPYFPKLVAMPSPMVEQRKLSDVSSGLIDKREARELLNTMTTQIDAKKREFAALASSYTALSLSSVSVDVIWNKMISLRQEIWQLERWRSSCLDGKKVVDEKEWLELYDELHAELLVNRNKLLSC